MTRRNLRNNPVEDRETKAVSGEAIQSRVDKLEANLKLGLSDLKNQLVTEKPGASRSRSKSTTDLEASLLEKISCFEHNVLQELEALRQDIKNMETKSSDSKQDEMCNNLIINGIPESQSENAPREVCKLVKQHLKIDISTIDIDYCYRLGRPDPQKVRPVAVRFVNRWVRDDIFKTKKNLKGSGLVITEQLIYKNLLLFKKVRSSVGVKNCWTFNGKVFVLCNNQKKNKYTICLRQIK